MRSLHLPFPSIRRLRFPLAVAAILASSVLHAGFINSVDLSSGFSGSASVLNFNGAAKIAGTRARLTDGGGSEAGTVWTRDMADIRKFTSAFTFQITPGSSIGEGLTFAIQSVGNTVVGGNGSLLGYGTIYPGSIAVKFDTAPNVSTTGLYVYGLWCVDGAPVSVDMAPSGIDLHSGHVFSVVFTYDENGQTLQQTVTDTQTNAVFTHSYTIDIPEVIGGTHAYVGFTGATGSTYKSTQEILTWSYSATLLAYDVQFSAFPAPLQLIPRNRTTNTAAVYVAGTEVAGGFYQAVLRVYRNGTQIGADQLQTLNYTGGTAPFSFTTTITAELAEYAIGLSLRKVTGQEFLVRRAENVVAGDVFIIQGQSNATTDPSGGNADAYISPFIRTFGVTYEDLNATISIASWFVATGANAQNYNPLNGTFDLLGGVGHWGLVLGNRLVTQNGVPVAILNAGHGGSGITYFQRNDTNHGDLTTNYGRLLYRMQQSGLAGAVRAILYYQGESEEGNATLHEQGYTSLHADWLVDYSSTEQFYVFQLREGGGVGRFDVDLRNRQRLFPQQLANVSVMSTNGLDGHDGLHYSFAGGYEELGWNIARMIQRDLYGGPSLANTDPPNPASSAVLSGVNHDRIRIPLWNKTDTVTFDNGGAQNDFAVVGAAVLVLSGTVTNGVVELQLSGSASGATAVKYTGHSGPSVGKWVANANGIGLLSFSVPIVTDTTRPVITLNGANPLTVAVGGTFVDPGASATDNVDGNLTAQITVSGGPVVTTTPRSYTLTYNVSDAAGNAAVAVTRTVHVTDQTAPVITLLGSAQVTVAVGGTFTDAGATATDNVDGNLSANITVTGGPVVTTAVGSYTLTYHVSDAAGNAATPVTRTVRVTDQTAPVITLLGANPLTVAVGGTFADPGATASDNVDGNLTASITVSGGPVATTTPGSYTLTYHVSDAAGNAAVAVTRTVRVTDQTAPVITLLGANPLTVAVGGTFADPGATASDNVDGNLTASITVSGGPVVTSAVGSYTLTYHVSDAAGNAATPVTRTVHVSDQTAPVITLLGSAQVTVAVGGTFTDPGATATDNVDGDLTSQITVTGGPVVTTAVGSYTLTYHVSDAAGNAATPVTRTVVVVEVVVPALRIERVANPTIETHIIFQTAVGFDYTLLASTDLASWIPLGTISGNGSEVDMIHADGDTDPRCFYVVKVTLSGQ